MYEIVQQTNYITEKQIEDGIKNGFKSILQYAYILHDLRRHTIIFTYVLGIALIVRQ